MVLALLSLLQYLSVVVLIVALQICDLRFFESVWMLLQFLVIYNFFSLFAEFKQNKIRYSNIMLRIWGRKWMEIIIINLNLLQWHCGLRFYTEMDKGKKKCNVLLLTKKRKKGLRWLINKKTIPYFISNGPIMKFPNGFEIHHRN
jgi:hypothetical protein